MAITETIAGIRQASSMERAAVGTLTSFAVTIFTSRAINYVREQRRPLSSLRSIGRCAAEALPGSGPRVHHFVPGIATAFLAGGGAIFTHQGGAFRYSVPFGTGVALTLDEFAILLRHRNPYWGSERAALGQGTVAAALASALAVRARRRAADRA